MTPITRQTVSLIITTYNRASLVTQAIDSVLAQTRVPDEIIVVDDGSSDDTQTVLSTYNPLVQVIRRENGGLSAARNTGLELATGDLIAFLDDDDTLTPDSIADRARFLEENSAIDVVYGEILMTDLLEREQSYFGAKMGITAPSGNVFFAFAERNRRPVHAFMFRRTVFIKVGGFDTALSCLEDYDFWLRVSAQSQFHYLPCVVGFYRFHPQQMTSTQRQSMIETELVVRERILNTASLAPLTTDQRARVYSIQGSGYMLLGKKHLARNCYRQAIRTNPRSARLYFLYAISMLGQSIFVGMTVFVRRFRSIVWRKIPDVKSAL